MASWNCPNNLQKEASSGFSMHTRKDGSLVHEMTWTVKNARLQMRIKSPIPIKKDLVKVYLQYLSYHDAFLDCSGWNQTVFDNQPSINKFVILDSWANNTLQKWLILIKSLSIDGMFSWPTDCCTNLADLKTINIMIGHQSISKQNCDWHGQIAKCLVKNVYTDDHYPTRSALKHTAMHRM